MKSLEDPRTSWHKLQWLWYLRMGEQMAVAVSGTWHGRDFGLVFLFSFFNCHTHKLSLGLDSQPGIFHSPLSLLPGMQILQAKLMSSDSCATLPSLNWVCDTCAIHLKALGCTGVTGLIGRLSGVPAVAGDGAGPVPSTHLAVGAWAMGSSLALGIPLGSGG